MSGQDLLHARARDAPPGSATGDIARATGDTARIICCIFIKVCGRTTFRNRTDPVVLFILINQDIYGRARAVSHQTYFKIICIS